MVRGRTRPSLAQAVLVLAALAIGCGDDAQQPPRADAAFAPDTFGAPADSQNVEADARIAPADTRSVTPDGTAWPDAATSDLLGNETGGSTSLDAGGDEAPIPVDAGRGDGAADGGPPPVPPVTIVVLPDTQYYAAAYPDVFAQQTSWILAQKTALNIAAVLHVGDVVDGAMSPDQWDNASTALRPLDNALPYLLVPGNHDTDGNRQGLMNTYFSPASMPWLAGTMTQGRIDNSFALADVGGRVWLLVGLEFGPRDAAVAWADSILKSYPTTPAMIVTHAYLYGDGTRYNLAVAGIDESKPSFQYFYPAYYQFTPDQGINDGEMLWQKLVLPNPNVRLVFCGHDSGAARLRSTRPDGSVVHQMLSDYQWWGDGGPNFGYGWLRVLQLDYAKKTIRVQTYSPYLQSYLTDDANQFTLDLYP